jgi:hypothetical protein
LRQYWNLTIWLDCWLLRCLVEEGMATSFEWFIFLNYMSFFRCHSKNTSASGWDSLKWTKV